MSNSTSNPAGSKTGRDPAFRVGFTHFTGTWLSWEELFRQAAEFATGIGPERLISISHSEDGNDGVVTVWYWEE